LLKTFLDTDFTEDTEKDLCYGKEIDVICLWLDWLCEQNLLTRIAQKAQKKDLCYGILIQESEPLRGLS
jgi:hypothetical protein